MTLCPFGRLRRVTRRAWIGNLVLLGHRRRDELEGVAADVDIRDGLLDFRHVAFDALTAPRCRPRGACALRPSPPRAVRRIRAVARQAQLLRRLDEIRVVIRPMHVMAAEAGDAAAIHEAVDEVVRLHAVLLRRALCVVSKRRLTEMPFFERPEILQLQPDVEADRPVVVLAVVRILRAVCPACGIAGTRRLPPHN